MAKEEHNNRNIHGNLDVSVKNDYITPRGLLVTDTGLTFQVFFNLFVDIYENPDGCLNKATIFAGVWNDIWTKQDNPYVGAWNELDWWVGVNFKIAQNWKLGIQVIPFLSPPHNFVAEDNIEFLIAYDDSKSGFPIAFNPYVKWFWAAAGDSTVIVGKRGGTYDIEIGLLPTLDLSKYGCNLPVILTAPTWITVGPANFWNGGELGLKHVKKNFGVFTTGLRGDYQLTDYVSTRFGKWYVYTGVQYYHLINKNLLEAQTITLGLSSIRSAHRDIGVGYAGIGFGF